MSEASDAVPQELVADKYRLTRLLGRGGMGSVWEGIHTSLGTRVAVKFIDADYADNDEAKNRFRNEARAAATLNSKHVVQVYDHGLMADGRPYIVMEFLSGEPLDKRLDRLGTLPLADTAQIIMQVSRALSKAHDAGIVHRDLKPENVFLVWDDEDNADIAKVVDFGIAKFTDPNLGASSSTRTGSVLGTPFYMSPEQARGLRTVDYRSDLWSIGVIAFRCIAGRLPFEGEAIGDVLVKICTAPVPVPSSVVQGVPPAFDAWFARALAREPGYRFQSARELSDELIAACGLSQRLPPSMADASGGYRALGSQPQATQDWARAGAEAGTVPAAGVTPPPAALTGAPTTQTPGSPGKGKSRLGLVVGLGLGGVLLLLGGGLVVYKLAGSAAASPDKSALRPAPSAKVAATSPPPAESASGAPAPAVSPTPDVAPAPSASAAEAPAPKASAKPAPVVHQHPVASPHVKTKPPANAGKNTGENTGKIDVGY